MILIGIFSLLVALILLLKERRNTLVEEMNNVPCVITGAGGDGILSTPPRRSHAARSCASHVGIAIQTCTCRTQLLWQLCSPSAFCVFCMTRCTAARLLARVRRSSAWGRILAPLLQTGGFSPSHLPTRPTRATFSCCCLDNETF